jgi:hypothetical protein
VAFDVLLEKLRSLQGISNLDDLGFDGILPLSQPKMMILLGC